MGNNKGTKITTHPPILRHGTKIPPMDPMTHEIVKSVSKFLGKVNRHLNKNTGHKLRLLPADVRIPKISPDSVKKS